MTLKMNRGLISVTRCFFSDVIIVIQGVLCLMQLYAQIHLAPLTTSAGPSQIRIE